MKAQTLSISVPNLGCGKNCPYCVSRMTGYIDHNFDLMIKNIHKVKKYADMAQVSNVLFTSKGEIFYNTKSSNMLYELVQYFKEYPIEIQTNGNFLIPNEYEHNLVLDGLASQNVNVLAISIDNIKDIDRYEKILYKQKDIIYRATINLTSILGSEQQLSFYNLINRLKKAGFRQVSFREITVPNFGMVDIHSALKTAEWISKNTITDSYVTKIKAELDHIIKNEARLIRKLPYGATLYDYNDIAITYFDYCIQDSSNEDDIRSLIFQEDGHLYTTWNSKASIIF